MAIYHVYNGVGTHAIRYRFTCCKCGKVMDWLEYTIRAGFHIRASGSYDEAAVTDMLHNGEQTALTTKIERMKKHISKGHAFNSPFSEKTEFDYFLDRKCPICGAKQPNKSQSVEYDWNGR